MMKELDLESLLFGSGGQRTEIASGDVLIAEPFMEESIFKRSSILMLEADRARGYMGLVLNHQIPLSMRDLIPGWKFGELVPLFAGGPVDLDRLFMLHTLGDRFSGSRELFPGLYVGARIDDVVGYVEGGGEVDGCLRFFLGYSGWGTDQLENEVLHNTWAIGRHEDADVLLHGSGNEYWRRQVEHLGDDYRSWLTVPVDAALN